MSLSTRPSAENKEADEIKETVSEEVLQRRRAELWQTREQNRRVAIIAEIAKLKKLKKTNSFWNRNNKHSELIAELEKLDDEAFTHFKQDTHIQIEQLRNFLLEKDSEEAFQILLMLAEHWPTNNLDEDGEPIDDCFSLC